ncbi:MAG TPA: hypothetical protein VE467_11945 [Chryseolinea sp.]|nr:hypothetical protein [Chryseolinea sp.]
MKKRIHWIIWLGVLLPTALHAQLPSNRIKPAEMYHAGDTIRSPRLGVQSKIPDGWAGVLPRDTEVFLLMPEDNTIGEVYVMVNEKLNLQAQMTRWQTGVELSDGLILKPEGEITKRGSDVIAAVGTVAGAGANNSQLKVYAEAKCSPYGFCISFLSTSDALNFEKVKKTVQTIVDNTVFSAPSNESPYKNFDWKKFLSGKIILAMGYDEGSKKIDEVDLCTDGTFHSKITRTGIFKGQAKDYTGKKQGTWDVKSNGEKATISLTFKKLPPVDVELVAKDEEIYINGTRHFAGESQLCQK